MMSVKGEGREAAVDEAVGVVAGALTCSTKLLLLSLRTAPPAAPAAVPRSMAESMFWQTVVVVDPD